MSKSSKLALVKNQRDEAWMNQSNKKPVQKPENRYLCKNTPPCPLGGRTFNSGSLAATECPWCGSTNIEEVINRTENKNND